MNYDEDEALLIDMVCETNEEVRNSLYKLYEPTINAIVKKYVRTASKLGIEKNDLLQEANVGFSDALNRFDPNKDASLKTFINICVERRLINCIGKNKTLKSKMAYESLSLDYIYEDEGLPLKEVLAASDADPSKTYVNKETYDIIIKEMKKNLSNFEFEVFFLMLKDESYSDIAKKLDKSPKQIDNTIQRIRFKLKSTLKGVLDNG